MSDNGSAAGASTVKKQKTKKKKKKKVAEGDAELEILEREDSLEAEAKKITELKQLR